MTKAEYLKLQECVRNLEERIKIHEELNDDNNMYINHLEEENEELRSIIQRKGYGLPYQETKESFSGASEDEICPCIGNTNITPDKIREIRDIMDKAELNPSILPSDGHIFKSYDDIITFFGEETKSSNDIIIEYPFEQWLKEEKILWT